MQGWKWNLLPKLLCLTLKSTWQLSNIKESKHRQAYCVDLNYADQSSNLKKLVVNMVRVRMQSTRLVGTCQLWMSILQPNFVTLVWYRHANGRSNFYPKWMLLYLMIWLKLAVEASKGFYGGWQSCTVDQCETIYWLIWNYSTSL